MKKKLEELTIEDLGLTEKLPLYEEGVDINETFISFIYNYLSSHPGFIRNLNTLYDNDENKRHYMHLIEKSTRRGQPIQVFLTAFRPKVKKDEVTNKQWLPDMADLLALTHLALIAKNVRAIYNPGFKFIVGYEGNFFRKVSNHNLETTDKAFTVLKSMKKEVERITGAEHAIEIVDVEEIVRELGTSFQIQMEREMKEVKERYINGTEKQLDKVIHSIYEETIELSDFLSDHDAKIHSEEQAIFCRAFKNIKYVGGEKGLGICEKYPNALKASVKNKTKTKMSIQLLPGYEKYPQEALTVKTKKGEWKPIKWMEIMKSEQKYTPIFFEGFDYPLYYEEN